MPTNEPVVNLSTVASYSERGSTVYDDQKNKDFLYGRITADFLRGIEFNENDSVVLDIGCGTGFVFEILFDVFKSRSMRGIGVEPAKGMLQIAIEKYRGCDTFSFREGSFENIPLPDRSVDRIVSTLALHWVKSLPVAAREMRRVLKKRGAVDILMIAKEDGAMFKKAIVAAQKRHLSFAQIMKTATLVQRATSDDVIKGFEAFHDCFEVKVETIRSVIYGSFDDHMKWWKARSTPVIAEVKDKEQFIADLRDELNKMETDQGIPFDLAYHCIKVRDK